MRRSVILIGFKSCGKTSVGSALAHGLQMRFIDTDQWVEKRYLAAQGRALDCAGILRTEGEPFFRALEKEVILNIPSTDRAVIATGGGVVLNLENKDVLQRLGTVIYLSISYLTWITRIQACPWPAFMDDESAMQSVFLHREPLYRLFSNLVYEADGASMAEIASGLQCMYQGR